MRRNVKETGISTIFGLSIIRTVQVDFINFLVLIIKAALENDDDKLNQRSPVKSSKIYLA